jgi:phosphopantothenoylcysteine synthetase/decarboxylase
MSMLNVYLFIELLGAADPSAVIADVKKLEIPNCTVKNAVQLADDKLVAHVDCKSGDDATRAVLEKFTSVDGIVQTNIIAVVKPKDG